MAPIEVMTAFYRDGADVAFRQKNEPDQQWWLCPRPLWNWGYCDYKVIDIELDDYFW